MAAVADDNWYYLSTSHNFQGILTWMRDVRDNMRLTGYCEVQANRMWRDHAANNDEWGQSYHFARAAQCVMRFALLRAVGLEGHCPSDSKSVENNREALEIVTEQDRANINGDGLLVNNQPEPVRLFYSYFDSLFATHFIMAKLRNLGAGQNDDITRQMIIYNRRNNVIWHITATLNVDCEQRIIRRVQTRIFRGTEPFVAVMRFDPIEGRVIDQHAPPPPPPNDDALGAVRELFMELKKFTIEPPAPPSRSPKDDDDLLAEGKLVEELKISSDS